MDSVDCNINGGDSTNIPWTYEANWIIAHGSLESSVAVETSDDPIAESDQDTAATKWPLILKPPGPDSVPCEIKICFKQKYEVGQIYVRSTARAYEIYYETSPNSIKEYLSTVRCGVAERDDKVLQTSCVEDVTEEQHGECGYLTAETASSGGSTGTSEDDWVKIKVPEAGNSPASDKTSTNASNNIQDLYEATAQISDSNPCSSLTIRLLSLQDRDHVYVDEIYVFVDPVESTDSENGSVLAGSSAQSSLMAMFMPTLLQLSKSGVSRAQEKSDEVLKNGKVESASTIIDSPQQIANPKELCKDTTESAGHQQHSFANKCGEEKDANGFQPSVLQIAMEQLVSRMSRVEDICLRFEEKMLKPIERIEARLQQVENQLEKLAKSSHGFGLPHCTRIIAPAFSCSESNSSSFYDDELDKKDVACDNIPDLPPETNFNPGLIMSAPEFSYGEDDEDNDELKPLEDSPCLEPKKTLSVDDALAAALNGFMSTAVNPSEPIQIPIRLLGDVDEEIQYQGNAKSCQIETRELPAADTSNTESSHYTQGLTVTAPDFTVEETGSEEQLNLVQSSSGVASVTRELPAADMSNTESSQYAQGLKVTAPDFTVEETGCEEQLNLVQSSSGVASVTRELPAADMSNTESSQYAQGLTVTAPDFTVEETDCEEQLNFVQSSSDVVSVTENGIEDRGTEMVPPSIGSADSCDFGKNKSTDVFGSSSNGDSLAASVTASRMYQGNGLLNGSSKVNMIETYFKGDTSCSPAEISNTSAPNIAKESMDTSTLQSPDETNLEKITNKPGDQDAASKEVVDHEAEIVSEDLQQNVEVGAERASDPSNVASLDFEFPILEVKFFSDVHMSAKSALEALLDDEAAESSTEAHSISTNGIDNGDTEEIDAVSLTETTDVLLTNSLLLDLGISTSHLEDASQNLCPPSNTEIGVSLI